MRKDTITDSINYRSIVIEMVIVVTPSRRRRKIPPKNYQVLVLIQLSQLQKYIPDDCPPMFHTKLGWAGVSEDLLAYVM